MDTAKIKKKYCTDDKVQVMFSNAPSQIICSKDGYLYLRDGDVTVHKYLSDPQRKKMPYRNKPTSDRHATHLFKYGQVYAKFTRYRNMADSFFYDEDSYSLTFLYFHKVGKGEAICSELYLGDFDKETETETTFTRSELEEFLYGTSGIKGKYILGWFSGIRYAKSENESISINKKFLDLSDEAIIELHNHAKEPIKMVIPYFDEESKKEDDESWKAHTIDEVTEFSMTNYGFNFHYPIMLVITDTEMTVYEFEVIYCGKDCYKVKSQKVNITPNLVDILTSAVNSEYPTDPSFAE